MSDHSPVPELPPGLDRRGFLKATAGGGVAIGLAALLPAGCAPDGVDAQQAAALASFSPAQFATARAAAEALLVDVPVEPERIALALDRELALVGGPVERDMKTLLSLLERLTFLDRRVRPFTELTPDERVRYLHTWRDSRFSLRRAAFNAVRSFIYFFAYSDPATWPLTGFAGPWPERFEIPAYPIDFGTVR